MDKSHMLPVILILIIAVVSILFYQSQGLKRIYKSEALSGITRTTSTGRELLTEADIKHLPEPVQKYLYYVGAVGREKVYSFRAVCDGEMKLNPNKGWVNIQSEQYNFFDADLTRLFYIEATMFGLPVLGLHSYTDEEAYMLIKIAGLFKVLDARGPEMRIGDTTTLFNDMCFFAPAALIDNRISWETIDSLTAKATFENNGCKISAFLYFNEKGELINFISDDRYYISMDGSSRKATWSTPIGSYKDFNGIRLPGYGEAVWKLPEGDYCYAKFSNVKVIEYNSTNYK